MFTGVTVTTRIILFLVGNPYKYKPSKMSLLLGGGTERSYPIHKV